jgi:hypothetical protein
MPRILCLNCEHVVERNKFCSNCATPLPNKERILNQGFSIRTMWEETSTTAKVFIGLISFFLFMFIMSSIMRTEPTNIQPQTQPKVSASSNQSPQSIPPASKPTSKPDPAQLRERLKNDYQSTIAAANPYLNFIKAQITKAKKGYSLWAVHSFFSQSSFSAGDDVKVVSMWIQTNRQDLQTGHITRVGFKNESGYLGSCWLEVQ